MRKSLFLAVAVYGLTIVLIVMVLYILSSVLFATGVEDSFNVERLYAYECGFASFSDARDAFDIKFYLVAILFLLFDLEITFLLPFAVTLGTAAWADCVALLVFLTVLTVGFVFEWARGGLDW